MRRDGVLDGQGKFSVGARVVTCGGGPVPCLRVSWLLGALSLCLGACVGSVSSPGQQPGSGGQRGPGGADNGTATGSTNGGGGRGPGSGASAGTGGSTAGAGGISVPDQPPAAVLVPTSRLVRLSRPQWENSVKDLLKLTDISAITANVTGDAVVGLDNDVDSLFVNDTFRSDLADAAMALAKQVTSDSASLAKLLPASAPADVPGKAKAFITTVGARAYRRALTSAEVTEATSLFNQGPTLYPGTDAFAAGANLVLQLFMQSPQFLYRTELSTAIVNGKIPLNDYEVASKLSYALANTMPDDTLFAAAASGQLHSVADVTGQATRLLTSDVGAQARDHLHFQIYRLGAYDGITRDTSVFPGFVPGATPTAMRQEVLLFLRWVFDQGLGVKEIFTSPVGFVNKTLAPVYKLSGTFTDQFQKVDLDPTQRSGLLTQAGFLSAYSVGNDPDAIHRGVFVNQRVLCRELPAPPPNAKPLIDPQPNMTNRQRVEATTEVAGSSCVVCHGSFINPAGFPFEEFDAVGQYRTMDRGQPINSADTYPFTEGPKSFSNAVEFSRALADSAQAHACYTQNWMTYLNGRAVTNEEMPLLQYWVLRSQAGKLPVKDMIVGMVTSESFLNRLP